MKVVLATTSQYRIKAMLSTGIPFEAKGASVDEYSVERPSSPDEIVLFLSRLKAEAVAMGCIDSLVIGMDSIGWFDGCVLEKPKSREDAFAMLKMLSGNTHSYITGVTAIDTKSNKSYQKIVTTLVEFRHLSDGEIRQYLEQDAAYNTRSGSYDASGGLSSTFVKRIDGDPHNLLHGIPLSVIVPMILEGIK